MLSLASLQQIWLYAKPTDMRKSFNGLQALIRNQLQQNPQSGNLFIFINRRRTMLKILYYEAHGYCIWHKRLDVGQFNFSVSKESVRLSTTDFYALVEGVQFKKIRQYKRNKI